MTNTTRTTADPILNQLARRLIDVRWQFDLTADEENACLEIERSSMSPKRLIALMRDYKTWVIRMYLAGAQRTFGYYNNSESGNLFAAFRYADMIRMYFWRYKHRDAYEPGDGQLNISAERANLDLVHETEVVQIIKDIEAHLQSTGAIQTPAQLEQQLKEKVSRQRAKPTLKGVMADAAEVQRIALSGLRQEVAASTALITGMIGQLSRLEQLIRDQRSPAAPPFHGYLTPDPLPLAGQIQVTCEDAAPCS